MNNVYVNGRQFNVGPVRDASLSILLARLKSLYPGVEVTTRKLSTPEVTDWRNLRLKTAYDRYFAAKAG